MKLQPVFDLVNAGPRHRFMVKTDCGELLVSNCTQAVARDLMYAAWDRLDKAGYPMVMSVHDELLAEVDAEFADLDEFCAIMAEVPAGYEGFPIAVAGWMGQRFRK